MQTQAQALELMRKRYASCKKAYDDISASIMLSDVAAKMNSRTTLRGGDDEPSAKEKEASVNEDSQGKKPITQAMLDKLGAQLLWLRQAQSELDQLFVGAHAAALRKELQEMATKIEKRVDESVAGRKFPKMGIEPPTDLFHKGVSEVVKEAKKYLKCKVTTPEMMTLHKDVPYYTTLVIAKHVNIKGVSVPSYILAISESTESHASVRKRYLTHLPEVSTAFELGYQWHTLKELDDVLKVILATHFFAEEVPSEATKKIKGVKEAVKGIYRSTILPNGAVEVRLSPGADIDRVAVAVQKYITEEVKQANPLFLGKIIHKEIERGGKTFLIFSAPKGSSRPKFKENDSLMKGLKVFEASLETRLDLNNLQIIIDS
jgi:hypothetical protein